MKVASPNKPPFLPITGGSETPLLGEQPPISVNGFSEPPVIGGQGGKPNSKTPRLIGWQGFTVRVPDAWDLTGFSGTDASGYLRMDDSEEQGLEIKWVTEPKNAKTEPDVSVRRESFFRALKQTAKKTRAELETRELDTYRPAALPDRKVSGFHWTGDRKAIGAVWYCRTCRRTVIAQVLGARSGRGGLSGVAESVLSTLRCHGDDPAWRTWSLYDLHVEIPSEYVLQSQQLMNVYLRLTFAHKTARLSVEQWAMANVARRDAYLDTWLALNSKAELREARYTAEETTAHEHPALQLTGGLKWGMPQMQAVREALRFQWPATRFSARAWECEASNKLYLVQTLRPARLPDKSDEVTARVICHARASR